MKQLLLALAATLLVACTETPVSTPVSTWDRGEAATVALVGLNHYNELQAYCSGVWYKDHIITAAHCLAEAQVGGSYAARSDYDRQNNSWATVRPYTVIHVIEDQDLALLSPLGDIPPHVNATLSITKPYRGQRVFSVGHPYGLGYTLCEGRIQSSREIAGHEVIHTDCELRPGHSGGPLFSSNGRLLGINSMAGPATEISFCIQTKHIRRLVEVL